MDIVKAKELVSKLIDKNLKVPVLLLGPPGIGKTEIVKQIAEEKNLKLFIFEGSSLDPTDVRGIPMLVGGETRFSRSPLYPSEDSILLIDELAFASTQTQRSLNSLLLDRRLGTEIIPSSCFVFATGNPPQYGGNMLLNTLINRTVILNIQPSLEAWLNGYRDKINKMIRAYLQLKPNNFYTFDPADQDKPFCSPRSWALLSRLMDAGIIDQDVFIGILGPPGADLIAFLEDEELRHINIDNYIRNRQIPRNMKVWLFIIESLIDKIKQEENISELIAYAIELSKHNKDIAYILFKTMAEDKAQQLFASPFAPQIYKLYGKNFMLDHI